MPVAVVDRLEVVDVDEHQSEIPVRAERPRDGGAELQVQLAAVQGAGQMVDRCVLRELRHAISRAHGRRHAREQLTSVERLDDVVDRSNLEPAYPVLRRGVSRQEDHRWW